jgi:hypothetical protein
VGNSLIEDWDLDLEKEPAPGQHICAGASALPAQLAPRAFSQGHLLTVNARLALSNRLIFCLQPQQRRVHLCHLLLKVENFRVLRCIFLLHLVQ